ncbi:hypothetical protein ACHAXS_002115 [Conticribra weissflogii]
MKMVPILHIPLILAHNAAAFSFSWTILSGTPTLPSSLYRRQHLNGGHRHPPGVSSRPPIIQITPEEESFPHSSRRQRHRCRHELCLRSSSQTNPERETLHLNNETAVDVSIDYCSACQWTLRATWLASEVLTTFANEPRLHSVSLVPRSPPLSDGGIFSVAATATADSGAAGFSFDGKASSRRKKLVLWDRKKEGRFPEAKEIKQLIRDVVNPDKDLGHSDVEKSDASEESEGSNQYDGECIECKEQQEQLAEGATSNLSQPMQTLDPSGDTNGTEVEPIYPSIFYQYNKISIEYSTGDAISSGDNGLYRASWYANELLTMVYARNAWWKKQQQQNGSEDRDCGDDIAPMAVDCVTLIPNRLDSGVLVRLMKVHFVKMIMTRFDDCICWLSW